MPAIIWGDSELPLDSLLFKCKIIVRFQTFDLYKMSKERKMLSIMPVGGSSTKYTVIHFLPLFRPHLITRLSYK